MGLFHASRLEGLRDDLVATREKWVHEDELVNQRVTWLLASQTFLIAAAGVGLFSENSDNARTYMALIVAALLGCSLTLWINRSLSAARRAMYFIASSAALHEYLRDVDVLNRLVPHPETGLDPDASGVNPRQLAMGQFREAWVRAVFHDLPLLARLRLRIWRAISREPSVRASGYDWAFKGRGRQGCPGNRPVSRELLDQCLRMFRLPSMNRLAIELAKTHGLWDAGPPALSLVPGDLRAPGLEWARGFHEDLDDLQWPYWRPDVTSGTSRGGDQAPTWMVRTFIVLWIGCIGFGAFELVAPTTTAPVDYRGAMVGRLTQEWDDAALAAQVVEGLGADGLLAWEERVAIDRVATTPLLEYQPDTTAAEEIDTLLVFTYGYRGDGDTESMPGPVNEQLTAAAEEFLADHPVPVYAQTNVAHPLKDAGVPDVTSIDRVVGPNGKLANLSTMDATKAILADATASGTTLGTVGVMCFSDHEGRCVLTAKAAGVDATAIEGVELPSTYDAESAQPWTRDRASWFIVDIAARLVLPEP